MLFCLVLLDPLVRFIGKEADKRQLVGENQKWFRFSHVNNFSRNLLSKSEWRLRAPFSYSKGNKFREEIRFSALLCLVLSFASSDKKRINAQIEARSAEARFCSRYKF